MTFGESINTCFSKYAAFEGRASSIRVLRFFLFTFLVYRQRAWSVIRCPGYFPGGFAAVAGSRRPPAA